MTTAKDGATGSEVWTLIVYVDDDPQERQFPTEQTARAGAMGSDPQGLTPP